MNENYVKTIFYCVIDILYSVLQIFLVIFIKLIKYEFNKMANEVVDNRSLDI